MKLELFLSFFSHESLRPCVCHVLAQTIKWRLATEARSGQNNTFILHLDQNYFFACLSLIPSMSGIIIVYE